MNLRHKPQLALLLSVFLAASTWFYFQRVLVPHQLVYAAAYEIPRGNLSDLYPRWLGTRELLLHHRDPYSPEVTRDIQAGYYGRPLDPSRTHEPKDLQGFVYPLYVIFLLAPTVHLPFQVVGAGFRWFLTLINVLSVFLWLRALRWRPAAPVIAILVLLTLGSIPAVMGIKLQQLTLVVAFMIALAASLVARGHLFSAGILLATATIKPQLALLPVAWLMLWSISDWRERQRLFWGFVLAMGLLIGGAEYVLPGWIGRFRLAIMAYRQYTGGGSLDLLLPPKLGTVLILLSLISLTAVCWRLRAYAADSQEFALVFSLVLAITVFIIPMMAPYNQVLLLPGIFLLIRYWPSLWRANFFTRLLSVLAIALVFWPWVISLTLMLAALFVPVNSLLWAWAVPLYTSLGIPLIIAGLIALLLAQLLTGKLGIESPAQLPTAEPSTGTYLFKER
jgi:hypothetical protein